MDREKLKELLESSSLLHASDAARVLPEVIDNSAGYVPASNLLDIYQTRAKLLSSKQGSYASQLLESTKEFISNLKLNVETEVFGISTDSDKEPHYLVFVTNTNIAVGCLKVVSQLNVGKQQW